MMLVGRSVLFRVSLEGERSLGGLFSGRGSFPAYVLGQDDVGVWITVETPSPGQAIPVVLLKWEYLATVTFDFVPEQPRKRAGLGFRRTEARTDKER